jgi:hypothetical protein
MKIKGRIWPTPLILLGLVLLLPNSCKKDTTNNPSDSITDPDGNVYISITLGTQTWMVENLRTTKSSDGTPIPLVSDAAGWNALATPGYCWYGNNENANKDAYGALYNWKAAANLSDWLASSIR